jgi:hypothetical protein
MATRLEGHPSMYVSINPIQICSLKCLLRGGGGDGELEPHPPPSPHINWVCRIITHFSLENNKICSFFLYIHQTSKPRFFCCFRWHRLPFLNSFWRCWKKLEYRQKFISFCLLGKLHAVRRAQIALRIRSM